MQPDDPSILAEGLRPLLVRINHMVRRRSPGWDLTAAQTSVLTTLMDRGPIRMGELAQHERVRMPTVTSMVTRLERMGLAERNPDPADRRAVLVGITEDGRRQIAELVAERNDYLAALLTELSTEERAHLAAALPALSRLLELDPGHEPRLPNNQDDDVATR